MEWWSIALGLSLAMGTSLAGSEAAPHQRLRWRVEAPAAITAGAPLPLTLVVTNVTTQPVWVLSWYTPLEGLWSSMFDVKCDGREIEYTGPLAKRARPTAADYRRIGPGQTVKATVDLAAVYNMPAGTHCSVTFSRELVVLPADVAPGPSAGSGESVPALPGGNGVTVLIKPAGHE